MAGRSKEKCFHCANCCVRQHRGENIAKADATVGDVVIGNQEKHEWARDPLIREIFTGLFGGFDDHLFERLFTSLSGGEKRRLQLTRLLMDSPNVLLLDEPTNDFDIETLTELEDLLDSYGGTLIVVSHDRYFLERVCDRFVGLLGDGSLRDLPRGVDQYLEQRIDALSNNKSQSTNKGTSSAAEQRQLKKDVARLEKQLLKLDEAINALVEEQSSAAFDAERLIEITAKLEELRADKNTKEEEWLFATTALDN